jgi:hypothetical protein
MGDGGPRRGDGGRDRLGRAGPAAALEGQHGHYGPDWGGGNFESGGSLMNRPLKKSKL